MAALAKSRVDAFHDVKMYRLCGVVRLGGRGDGQGLLIALIRLSSWPSSSHPSDSKEADMGVSVNHMAGRDWYRLGFALTGPHRRQNIVPITDDSHTSYPPGVDEYRKQTAWVYESFMLSVIFTRRHWPLLNANRPILDMYRMVQVLMPRRLTTGLLRCCVGFLVRTCLPN